MKKYVTPKASEIHVDFDSNLAMEFDPNKSTEMQLGKNRDEDFEDESMKDNQSWTKGLW